VFSFFVNAAGTTRIKPLLERNQRRADYTKHLLQDGIAPSQIRVHMSGDGSAGKTSLSSALRRTHAGAIFKPWRAIEADRPDKASARTRGVVVKYHSLEGRRFSFWDYAGQPEFRIGHIDHLQGEVGLAVYVIVINLSSDDCARQLRDWRRLIRACVPPGREPIIVLVGSRPHSCKDPQQLVERLAKASDDSGLNPILAAFALDCRSHSACEPLRKWLVQQHAALVAEAAPVPRASEAVLERKPEWLKERHVLLSWEEFCKRCRTETALSKATDQKLRLTANYLHDTGEVCCRSSTHPMGPHLLSPHGTPPPLTPWDPTSPHPHGTPPSSHPIYGR
jgi:hypothetical protein